MVVFTKHGNDKRIAIDLDNIITVSEREDSTIISHRISPMVATDAGIMFSEVNETFDEVMRIILDYRDDKRWRAEQRARLV